MKFTKIGTGINTQTKTGKYAIHLTLDKDAQKQILNHDFEKGIWLFETVNKAGKKYHSVMCPMPDDYEINFENLAKNWQKKFETKHKNESQQEFQDWTER